MEKEADADRLQGLPRERGKQKRMYVKAYLERHHSIKPASRALLNNLHPSQFHDLQQTPKHIIDNTKSMEVQVEKLNPLTNTALRPPHGEKETNQYLRH